MKRKRFSEEQIIGILKAGSISGGRSFLRDKVTVNWVELPRLPGGEGHSRSTHRRENVVVSMERRTHHQPGLRLSR